MIKNVGHIDKTIRLIVGLVLIAFGALVLSGSGLGIAAMVVGAVLLGTGVLNFCPAFKLLGISSVKTST